MQQDRRRRRAQPIQQRFGGGRGAACGQIGDLCQHPQHPAAMRREQELAVAVGAGVDTGLDADTAFQQRGRDDVGAGFVPVDRGVIGQHCPRPDCPDPIGGVRGGPRARGDADRDGGRGGPHRPQRGGDQVRIQTVGAVGRLGMQVDVGSTGSDAVGSRLGQLFRAHGQVEVLARRPRAVEADLQHAPILPRSGKRAEADVPFRDHLPVPCVARIGDAGVQLGHGRSATRPRMRTRDLCTGDRGGGVSVVRWC